MQIMHKKSPQQEEVTMTKEITPEVIERAIGLLPIKTYCCISVAVSIREEYNCRYEYSEIISKEFLHPLLKRDNISNGGSWTFDNDPDYDYPISRRDWLRKIAQELRDGKI